MSTRSVRADFTWLLRMRWGAIAGQLVLLATVRFVFDLPLAMAILLALVGVGLVSNVALTAWLKRGAEVTSRALFGVMLLDAGILAALLALSGGPFNPFSIFFLVNLTLGAILLPARACWSLVGVSLALFGALFLVPERSVAGLTLLGHAELMQLHLQGMWVAFAGAAAFIVFFVRRVMKVLAGQQETIAATRRLTGLATFVAGAAHELSTPLSTIAVASAELERTLADPAIRDDVQLIRKEVRRCRDLLRELAAGAGHPLGEAIITRSASEWIRAALEGLPQAERITPPNGALAHEVQIPGPKAALDRALRSVLKNALQASESAVVLELSSSKECVLLAVKDSGAGMSTEVLSRAGEPFFTTKPPTEGMGLRLFLARSLLEQLGGTLALASAEGKGTVVTLQLPVAPASVSP